MYIRGETWGYLQWIKDVSEIKMVVDMEWNIMVNIGFQFDGSLKEIIIRISVEIVALSVLIAVSNKKQSNK